METAIYNLTLYVSEGYSREVSCVGMDKTRKAADALKSEWPSATISCHRCSTCKNGFLTNESYIGRL